MTWEFSGRNEAFEYIEFNKKSISEIETFLGKRIKLDLSLFSHKKLNLSRQALLMLVSMNEYDQKQVVKEMYFVTANPNEKSVVRHKRNPLLRIFRTRYPFKNYHYLLTCMLKEGKVVIHDIAFDQELHGKKIGKDSSQRTIMYHVRKKKDKNGQYDGTQDERGTQLLMGEWNTSKATITHQIKTLHATVNGMQNNYEKASRLMGLHTQVAYKDDNPREYTLFHNPSDGAPLDLVECVFDKTRFTSHNAQHLAAVMKQCAKKSQKVKWTVHSQGAIIFNSALEYARQKNPRLRLLNQELVVHAGGSNTQKLGRNAELLGLRVHYDRTRTSPFDVVPNIAARQNKLSPSSLVRCCKFLGLVMNGSMTESPHTLPYFGVESYRKQLIMSGSDRALKRLKDVDNYLRNKGR
jgi:hypothetical protein